MFSPGVVSLATSILMSTTGFVLAAQDDPYPACYQFFTTWPQASSVNVLITWSKLWLTTFIFDHKHQIFWGFNFNFSQASSGIHSDIDSAQSCQLLCVQTEDCVAFSWHFGSDQFDENTCQLFSGFPFYTFAFTYFPPLLEVGKETSSCFHFHFFTLSL